MKRKSCVKSLRSLFNRKHILSHLLLFYSVSLLKENPKWLMKRYLSTAIERKSCLTEVFLPMCDLSLIGKHIVAYAPLLLCFFIEGKSYVTHEKISESAVYIYWKENPVKYNLYLFVYVISYCRINLWHVWSFSDRETYFVVWTPLILFLYWRKILCVIVLMHETWEKTSGIIMIR